MAMVSVTFRMGCDDYVRMTEVIAAGQGGLRASAGNVSEFIRKAVRASVEAKIVSLKGEDSGADLGRWLFEVE